MPFIVMHFKEKNLQRCFWLFTSLSNPYDFSSFILKVPIEKVVIDEEELHGIEIDGR